MFQETRRGTGCTRRIHRALVYSAGMSLAFQLLAKTRDFEDSFILRQWFAIKS
jgi:hypothetical protein